MSESETEKNENAKLVRGGASGPKANLRKGFQAFVLVAFLIILFTAPGLNQRAFIFGTMILVVTVDLLMLWRGDLDWTHFQSKKWSYRVNLILLALAVGLFFFSLTDRF
jgi:hypothetical protein